jgi:hypothetical protein
MPNAFFYHESNLVAKSSDTKGNVYRPIREEFIRFKQEIYDPYKQKQMRIRGISRRKINAKTELLNEYYRRVDEFIALQKTRGWRITSQSKFRPTVLEEFCGYLFKDIPEIARFELDFFNKNVFAGIVLDRNGKALVKTKDIDFCIGKKFIVNIGSEEYQIIIPIIAIECKTYIDKTMFSESQYTAQKMKHGSPNVRVYCIAERNEIDTEEIPTKGQTPLDQIFIIRGKETNLINSDATFMFFKEIRESLKQLSKDIERKEFGGILPD